MGSNRVVTIGRSESKTIRSVGESKRDRTSSQLGLSVAALAATSRAQVECLPTSCLYYCCTSANRQRDT